MTCESCGASIREHATYCEMCGARLAAPRAGRVWHGLTGTAVVVLVAAIATGLAMIVGLIVLIRALLQ